MAETSFPKAFDVELGGEHREVFSSLEITLLNEAGIDHIVQHSRLEIDHLLRFFRAYRDDVQILQRALPNPDAVDRRIPDRAFAWQQQETYGNYRDLLEASGLGYPRSNDLQELLEDEDELGVFDDIIVSTVEDSLRIIHERLGAIEAATIAGIDELLRRKSGGQEDMPEAEEESPEADEMTRETLITALKALIGVAVDTPLWDRNRHQDFTLRWTETGGRRTSQQECRVSLLGQDDLEALEETLSDPQVLSDVKDRVHIITRVLLPLLQGRVSGFQPEGEAPRILGADARAVVGGLTGNLLKLGTKPFMEGLWKRARAKATLEESGAAFAVRTPFETLETAQQIGIIQCLECLEAVDDILAKPTGSSRLFRSDIGHLFTGPLIAIAPAHRAILEELGEEPDVAARELQHPACSDLLFPTVSSVMDAVNSCPDLTAEAVDELAELMPKHLAYLFGPANWKRILKHGDFFASGRIGKELRPLLDHIGGLTASFPLPSEVKKHTLRDAQSRKRGKYVQSLLLKKGLDLNLDDPAVQLWFVRVRKRLMVLHAELFKKMRGLMPNNSFNVKGLRSVPMMTLFDLQQLLSLAEQDRSLAEVARGQLFSLSRLLHPLSQGEDEVTFEEKDGKKTRSGKMSGAHKKILADARVPLVKQIRFKRAAWRPGKQTGRYYALYRRGTAERNRLEDQGSVFHVGVQQLDAILAA